ncbi:MAG: cation-transporting P-type ATPase [Anaerolineales bacterium]
MDARVREILTGPWWSRPIPEILDALGVEQARGLSTSRVEEMRARYGANEMREGERTGLLELLRESLSSPVMLLLLAVAGISLALGKIREAIVMAVVVLIYVGVELYNKARTDRTMARLRELQAPRVAVIREGERREVQVEEVVVGDVLPLQPAAGWRR